MRKLLVALWETLEVALVAIVTVLVIRTFLIQPFLVSGASIEPNFSGGDYLIIDEIAYRFREPQRGEVIVFRYLDDKKTFFIKRIIGLPGEKIKISNGKVLIFNEENKDGLILKEDYIPTKEITSGNVDMVLSETQYFVLGDNRLHSFDSRGWGPLPENNLIGIVRLRLWPLNKLDIY